MGVDMMPDTFPIIAQAADEPVTLTIAGAVIMTLSIGLVLTLLVFCMCRILREPAPDEHHHAPLNIDTHDLDS